jgi:hypothetical protein
VTADGSKRGKLVPKSDYPGQPNRFRRAWSVSEFKMFLEEQGFSPVYWGEHHDFHRKKKWLDFWSIKS